MIFMYGKKNVVEYQFIFSFYFCSQPFHCDVHGKDEHNIQFDFKSSHIHCLHTVMQSYCIHISHHVNSFALFYWVIQNINYSAK